MDLPPPPVIRGHCSVALVPSSVGISGEMSWLGRERGPLGETMGWGGSAFRQRFCSGGCHTLYCTVLRQKFSPNPSPSMY